MDERGFHLLEYRPHLYFSLFQFHLDYLIQRGEEQQYAKKQEQQE